MVLSPGGRLTTRFTLGARDVVLEAGDGFFEVTHDKRRPFSVAASGRTLTVLGTALQRRRRRAVDGVAGRGLRCASASSGAPNVLLHPGERYVGDAGVGGAVRTGDVRSDAAWTDGRVALADVRPGRSGRTPVAGLRAAGRADRSDPRAPAVLGLPAHRAHGRRRRGPRSPMPVRRGPRPGDLVLSPATKSSGRG
ncbi:hypothetical protein ACRAWD_29445 [Caulobacter segnis]